MIQQVGGYVTDVPYVRSFIRELTPAWLDHTSLISGFTPPSRDAAFAWCDLGCGQGITTVMVAGTYPKGSCHGIDAMPLHIDSAKRFASEAAIPNVTFHAADFDAAADFDLPRFDYIVSHGVYTWVGERTRQSWRRFIDRHLKPRGLVYVSYNAMPGRAVDMPLQRLLRTLARSFPGNSQERVAGALPLLRALAELKAPALVSSPMAAAIKERVERLSVQYLAHEFLGADWEPLCVTEVRAALADVGLQPAGSATLMENYDSFVLGRAARETLAAIEDPDTRELARDFLIDQFFRRDVFTRGGQRLEGDARRRRLLESTYALAQRAAKVEYSTPTPAGKLRFDNGVARHIVNALAAGPRRLVDIAEDSIPDQDLLANALVLCAAGSVVPVESTRVSVANINTTIFNRLGGPEEIDCVALPFGTALVLEHDQLAQLRKVSSDDGDEVSAWIRSQINQL